MEKEDPMTLEIKYRTWFKGVRPQPIKLQIPGWAGEPCGHGDGNIPQPWYCQPFVDGSTYGLELVYPFETECQVVRENGEVKFLSDFRKENGWDKRGLPFNTFAPGHYGFTSSIDIKPPDDYVLRLEPHPRFFTDLTGTVPIAVTGHIQSWWCRIFFVAFKSPKEGEKHIFRHGEPYAQILIVPKKVNYDIKKMTDMEIAERSSRETKIKELGPLIAKNTWRDHKGNTFDDKYKQISLAFSRGGEQGVIDLINKAGETKNVNKQNIKRIKKKFFKANHETKTI